MSDLDQKRLEADKLLEGIDFGGITSTVTCKCFTVLFICGVLSNFSPFSSSYSPLRPGIHFSYSLVVHFSALVMSTVPRYLDFVSLSSSLPPICFVPLHLWFHNVSNWISFISSYYSACPCHFSLAFLAQFFAMSTSPHHILYNT